jgi:hypothetical protein
VTFDLCNLSHPRRPLSKREARRRERLAKKREAVRGVMAALSQERRSHYGKLPQEAPRPAP